MQPTIFYPVRVDNVNPSTVLDPSTGRVFPELPSSIRKENGNLLVGRIGWLSQSGKKIWLHGLLLKRKVPSGCYVSKRVLRSSKKKRYNAGLGGIEAKLSKDVLIVINKGTCPHLQRSDYMR